MPEREDRELEVQLEGAPEYGGKVRLDELHQFLRDWYEVLAAVDREVTGATAVTTAFPVVGLSYASPAKVRVEAVPEPGKPDHGPDVVARFKRELDEIKRGIEPEGIHTSTLIALEKLTTAYKKHVTRISFRSDDTDVIEIPANFGASIAKLLRNVYRTRGVFRGRLEGFNLHEKPIVWLYPLVGPKRIRCLYRLISYPRMGALVDTKPVVDVFGVLKFRGDAPYPHEIDIERIEVLEQSGLPTADEIAGSMPGLVLVPDEE